MDGACWVCFCCRHSPVLSRTWLSGSFESVWWNACVHKLDLGLYSHVKEFVRNGVRNHGISKGKIPSTGGSQEGWTHDTASRRTVSPTLNRLSYSSPDCDVIVSFISSFIHYSLCCLVHEATARYLHLFLFTATLVVILKFDPLLFRPILIFSLHVSFGYPLFFVLPGCPL